MKTIFTKTTIYLKKHLQELKEHHASKKRIKRNKHFKTLHKRLDTMPEHLKYEYELFLDLPWPKKRKGNDIA